MKYKILNQTNPNYKCDRIRKSKLLFKGGEDILENAKLFIPKEPQENDSIYEARLQCASYKNYLSNIINDFTSETFSKQLHVLPEELLDSDSTTTTDTPKDYKLFFDDADLQGNDIPSVLKEILTQSLIHGRAYIGIDFPKVSLEQEPDSLLDEEKLGTARPYLYQIDTESVIDWETDDFNNYKLLVLKREISKRSSFLSSRDEKVIQFKVWEKEGSTVKWTTYEITCKDNKEPEPDEEVIEVDSSTVSFPKIPILCLEMPSELCIGNLIGSLCSTHFKRESALIWAMNRSLFAIAVYKQGPELPASGDLSDIGSNPHRGNQTAVQMRQRNFAVIGPDDDLSFAEPSGASYELTSTHLKELVDEIYRIVNAMSQSITSTSKSLQRASESRQIDRIGKEKVLQSYANDIKQFVIKIYDLITSARSEDINWVASGLNNYKSVDKALLLQEASQISLINIPSEIFQSQYLSKVAFELLPELSPELKHQIQEQILKNTKEFMDEKKKAKEMELKSKDKDSKDKEKK